jgi:hypothetical protein
VTVTFFIVRRIALDLFHFYPKAHRKEGIFEVRALHLEPGVVVDDALVTEVVVRYATRPGLAKRLSD